MGGSSVERLMTPCLLLDGGKLERNIALMAGRMASLGVALRPHVKTNKSADVTRRIVAGGQTRGLCVSTLKEAEYFFAQGHRDILYAVGIAPGKLDWVADLRERGCALTIILDSLDMARRAAAHGAARGMRHEVMIELDTDGHRAGVVPEGDLLLEIGRVLTGKGAMLRGVMTHAGGSYACTSTTAIGAMARQERDRTVLAADRLRGAGLPCSHVSVGSTPTALFADDLSGVTEVRAGVYAFFDLVMAGLGVCAPDDIAISVLSSVIGHQPDKGIALCDAGWMALSRDRGTAAQTLDYGYGLVTDLAGRAIGDLIVTSANQEHGLIASRSHPSASVVEALPVGHLVRILPNHACATAAQYDRYTVVQGQEVLDEWPRINGW